MTSCTLYCASLSRISQPCNPRTLGDPTMPHWVGDRCGVWLLRAAGIKAFALEFFQTAVYASPESKARHSNTGFGLAAAQHVLNLGCSHPILAARNISKGNMRALRYSLALARDFRSLQYRYGNSTCSTSRVRSASSLASKTSSGC
ncbi:hypothetical protein BT69DRAFT_135216 [Atractiella rhizophila]|nr:hypothetical protein BT69DRAFT_135216 [Atractiella rhizophila]